MQPVRSEPGLETVHVRAHLRVGAARERDPAGHTQLSAETTGGPVRALPAVTHQHRMGEKVGNICPLGCKDYFHFSNSPLAFLKSFSNNEASCYAYLICRHTYTIREKGQLFFSHLPGEKIEV